MSLKRIAVAIVVVLALGAATASSASAVPTTAASKWFTGHLGETEVTTALNLKAGLATHAVIGKKFQIKTTIGGKAIEIIAKKLTCFECKIENKEVTGLLGKVAFATGKLKFTEASVETPKGCTVSSEANVPGEIISKQLNVHADAMEGALAMQAYLPAAMGGTVYLQFKLEGGECAAIAGAYNIIGGAGLYGEDSSPTNTFGPNMTVKFSPTIGGTELKVGVNKAELTGSIEYSLESAEFGIK